MPMSSTVVQIFQEMPRAYRRAANTYGTVWGRTTFQMTLNRDRRKACPMWMREVSMALTPCHMLMAMEGNAVTPMAMTAARSLIPNHKSAMIPYTTEGTVRAT